MDFCWSKIILATFFSLSFVSAKGQGCCSGGAPLSGNLTLDPIETGVLSVRLVYDYNNLRSVVAGRERLGDNTRTRLTQTGLLRVDYEFYKKWTVSALLTYVRQTEKVSFGSINNSVFGEGFGDMVLIANYNLLSESSRFLSFGIGAKIPTGSISKTNQQTNLLLPPDLQPGTGAWDIIAISQFTEKHLFLIRNLNLNTNVTFRYTTSAPRFQQQQIYKFGNILQTSVGLNYNFLLNNDFLLTPQVSVRYRYSLADQTNGFNTINTGGHWVYFRGGVETTLSKEFSFSLNMEAPVFWKLEGVQLTTSYKITAGLVCNFYKQKAKVKSNTFDIL